MTIKEANDSLGQAVTFRGNLYTIAAIIKRLTDKGIIWQVELKPASFGNSIVIARAKEMHLLRGYVHTANTAAEILSDVRRPAQASEEP